MTQPFVRVFLKSPAGEVELSTHDHIAPFKLLDGARGLGLPKRAVESTPIPSGHGSVFRSQRFDESEMMLPVAIRDADPTVIATKARELERVLLVDSDDPIEIRVEAPGLGAVRRRFAYYLEGLEGAVGGSDSHFTWRHVQVKLQALDPLWYGADRTLSQRVDAGRKPFLTGSQSMQLRRNLCWDGGLAYPDAISWFGGTRDTEVKKSGSASMRLDSNEQIQYLFLIPEFEPDRIHSVGVQVRVAGPISHVRLRMSSDPAGEVNVIDRIVPVGEDWTRITGTSSVAVKALPGVFITPGVLSAGQFTPATSGQLWADEAIVEASPTVGPFFDGDTPDAQGKTYSWEGEPGASASSEVLAASPRAIPFFPVILASSTVQGAFEFVISGDTDTWPIWTITGPGEDLLIQNDITGEQIFIKGEFKEKVIIDTRPTVADIYSPSAMDGQLWSRVGKDYTLFPLRRGTNRIRISMVNARPDSLVKLKYSEMWLAGW